MVRSVANWLRNDPAARALIAAGFDRWAAAISDGLRSLDPGGMLPADIDPDDLATTLLATLQGGLLLAQVHRNTRQFETAVDTLLALALGRRTLDPTGHEEQGPADGEHGQ